MNNEKLSELMHQELDGTLSPKGKEKLEKELNQNDEARLLMNKLRLVHSKLHKIEEVETPSGLTESVMSNLPVSRHAVKEKSPSVIDKIISLIDVPRVQMAGMFSMGMAAALLLFVIAENYNGNQKVTADDAVGTIGTLKSAAEKDIIDSRIIYSDGCSAEVKTSREGNLIMVEIDLDVAQYRTVQLFATSEKPGELRFSAVEQSVPNLAFANFGFDYFSASVAGNGKLILVFEDQGNDPGPIQIELKTDNSSALEAVKIKRVNL